MAKVKVFELKEGYRIVENIYGLTKYPIIPKNTEVTPEIIEVLEAFLIEEVEAERISSGRKSIPVPEKKEEKSSGVRQAEKKSDHFRTAYLKMVRVYKREFQNWQAGYSVDIHKIREDFIPLFELVEKNPCI